VGKGASGVLIGVAALAACVLVAGAGTSAAANGHHYWRDNGRGPWITNVCSSPTPRVAGCSADVVTNSAGTPNASSSPLPGSVGPSAFHSAYSLPTAAPNAQTIGIVDAYDDPNIAADLASYDSYYGLPAPPSFQKVNETGGTTYPRANASWSLEISLDVEVAHAICQNCNILLVEASSNQLFDLGAAENEAVKLGATVVSNSWGASEYSGETSDELQYFHHAGVPITASAGDNGYGVEFPAASQYVTAVGGTTLTVNTDGSYGGETVWNGTGSGCSRYEPKPSWQHDSCAHRALNDVAADADPNSGAAVFDSVSYQLQTGWFRVGGTSLASPLIAAVYALAGNPASLLYGSSAYAAGSSALHDVTSGANGNCGTYLCIAGIGYDGPTGLGTPAGLGAFTGAPLAPPTVPGAPVNLQATGSNQSASLQWAAPLDNGGSGITSYDIYRGTSSNGEVLVHSGVTGTSYTDSGLTNGTTYYYEVTAVNGVGEGGRSNEAVATPAPGVPGAPTGLQATGNNNSVSLSWTGPLDNGGSLVSGYDVYRGTSPGGESSTPIATGVTTTSYVDGTAVNGTTYYYKVTALNGTGEGARSNEASATPHSPLAGNFSIAISPSSRSMGGWGSATYTVTITPNNGFSGQVSLSVSGLPARVTATFSPNPAGTSSTLTLRGSGAASGQVRFTVTATSGSLTHSASAALTIF
jgi:subtilase family serine protease